MCDKSAWSLVIDWPVHCSGEQEEFKQDLESTIKRSTWPNLRQKYPINTKDSIDMCFVLLFWEILFIAPKPKNSDNLSRVGLLLLNLEMTDGCFDINKSYWITFLKRVPVFFIFPNCLTESFAIDCLGCTFSVDNIPTSGYNFTTLRANTT